MAKKNKKEKNVTVRILPVSIIIFLIVAAIAIFIILGKGKIAGYSLVKIETSTDSSNNEPVKEKDKLEIIADKKYLSIKSKEKAKLTVLLNGEEVDISNVELESSNEDVVKVSELGIVTSVSEGKAFITVTKDDLIAKVDLRVIVPIKSISFTATNSVIRVGKSLQMKLVAQPSDANVESLKYESSDEDIATVNSNGIVTGVSPGNVTITVTDMYNEDIEKTVKLTIKK